MTREKFLSTGFNNLLALALGVIVVVYISVMVAGSAWTGQEGFIGMAVLGALY